MFSTIAWPNSLVLRRVAPSVSFKRGLQGQEDNGVFKVRGVVRFSNGFEVADAPPDGDALLVCVDDPSEGDTGTLAASRFGEEVVVLREQHTTQLMSPVQ